MARYSIKLGKLMRVSMSVLMIGTLIIGGFFASISLLSVNQALDRFGALCKHRKTLSKFIMGSNQPSLTIFTAPTKPFSDSSNDPQYQALLSWLTLEPTPKIVLLGKDPSFYKVSKLLCDEVSVEPNIDSNLWGTLQVHSIFARAQQANTDISMIISTHTLLFQDLMKTLHKTHQDHQNWVLFGKPRDVHPENFSISFTNTGPPGHADITSSFPINCREIADLVISNGSLRGPVSYWAWNNDNKKNCTVKPLLTTPIPPFSYLLGTFEEWILQHLLKEAQSRAIIDASEVVTSVRMASNSSILSSSGEEARINAMLHGVEQKAVFSFMRDDDSGQLPHNFTKSQPRTLDALLPQVADANKVVVMVGGTSNYKEMLLSFICRAQSLGVQNILIAAFDEGLYEYAYMQGLPVYLESSSEEYKSSIGSDGQCIFESKCFKQVSKLKSMSVLRVLKKGYTVLWSDMDIAWFENPLPELLALGSNTLPIQSDEPSKHRANSGFYLARAEEKTIRAFEAIVKHAMKSETTEQPSFYIILCGEKEERRVGRQECVLEDDGVRTIFLSEEKYPNGYVYGHWETDDASESCKKKQCVVLHNNFIAGKETKLMRLVKHRLWFYDVSNRMCIQPWHLMRNSTTFKAHFLAALNITSYDV